MRSTNLQITQKRSPAAARRHQNKQMQIEFAFLISGAPAAEGFSPFFNLESQSAGAIRL